MKDQTEPNHVEDLEQFIKFWRIKTFRYLLSASRKKDSLYEKLIKLNNEEEKDNLYERHIQSKDEEEKERLEQEIKKIKQQFEKYEKSLHFLEEHGFH